MKILEENVMENIFYVREYAQHLERDQLIANLEQVLEICTSDDEEALDELSDEKLDQIVMALEQSVSLLLEKSASIQSQQQKVESKLDRLYLSKPLRERILKRRKIEDMDFSVRVYNPLKRANVSTLHELCSKSPNEVSLIFRGNRRLLNEVEKKLNEKRLRLYGVDEGDGGVADDSTEELQRELERKFDELFGPLDE